MSVFKQLSAAIVCSGVVLLVTGFALGQNAQTGVSNNPYSPSPEAGSTIKVVKPDVRQTAAKIDPSRLTSAAKREAAIPPIPKKSDEVVKAAQHPSNVYRIGVNDVLRINLMNSNGGVRYIRVGADGWLDFPLAPRPIFVVGKTTAETTRELQDSIKLFSDPRISVEVREYASHIVSIGGLVDQPGGQQIQRDAVPFFVIRAGVTPDPKAGAVRITRNGTNLVEDYGLSDRNLASVYVYPGDRVDFLEPTILHKD